MKERDELVESFTELLVEKIEHEFQEDPIFHKINSLDLKGALFSNLSLMETIDFSKHYSTKEAASFLGDDIKEYRLTNTLNREILFPYFRVTRKGSANRYHYDWKSIWRFKMVFLLADIAGVKLVDLEKLLDNTLSYENDVSKESADGKPLVGERVEVIVVSETLDAIKKEIEDNKRFFQEALEEVKTADSQRNNELLSTLKDVLIQEYTQQDKFLEKMEEQLKNELKRKKWRSFLFINFEIKDSYKALFEGMLTLINEEKELLNKKVGDLKRLGNNSLTYHPMPRMRNVSKYKNVQS